MKKAQSVKANDLFLKKISDQLLAGNEIPLLRGEPIDLENFTQNLQKTLNLENLNLEFQTAKWEKTEDIFNSFGADALQICFSLTPLIGSFYLILDRNEPEELLRSAFSSTAGQGDFLSKALKEGFLRYAILQILKLLQKEKLFQGLNFKIIEEAEIQSKTTFCLDFQITFNEKTFPLKIALTPDFRFSWNQYHKSKGSLFFSALQKNLQLPLSFILAETQLTVNELKTIKPGDFLLADKIYFDPKTGLDSIKVQLYSVPIFQVKLKKEKMQIIDFAHLEEPVMENQEKKPILEESEKPAAKQEIKASESKKQVSIDDLPLTITAELSRMQMPLSEMTALQPGNFLELPSSLEEGVDLCVNGKKFARGELVHLGEKLGVRILEIK